MTAKKCLQGFLDHVASLEEDDPDTGDDGYTSQFQALKEKSLLYRSEKTFSTVEGEKENNRRKNRYKDILPFEHTRVVLKKVPTVPGSDYINANFIKGAGSRDSYIASQGPLPATVDDFWRMAWEYQVQVIVMVCSEFEDGKPKCQRYWPPQPGEATSFGDIKVVLEEEVDSHQEFLIRILHVTVEQETRTIKQFHYRAWPDHGITTSVTPILDMIGLVREAQPQETPPIIVHCSAGCGRTGTICSIDYAWNILKQGKLTLSFRLYDIIAAMRTQRPSIVQAKDQYMLVHRAVAELFKRQLEVIEQNDYENVDLEGNVGRSIPVGNYQNVNLDEDGDYADVGQVFNDSAAPPAVPKRTPATHSIETSDNHVSSKQRAPSPILPGTKNIKQSSPKSPKIISPTGPKPVLSPKPSPNSTLEKPKIPSSKPKLSSSDDKNSRPTMAKPFQNNSENPIKEVPTYATVDKKGKSHTMPNNLQNVNSSSETAHQMAAHKKPATLPGSKPSIQHITQIKLSPTGVSSRVQVGYPNNDEVFVDNALYSSVNTPKESVYSVERQVPKSSKTEDLYSKEQVVSGNRVQKPFADHTLQMRPQKCKPDVPNISEYSEPFELPERSSDEYSEPYNTKMKTTFESNGLYTSVDADHGPLNAKHKNGGSSSADPMVFKSGLQVPPRKKKSKGASDCDQTYEEVGIGPVGVEGDDDYDEVRWKNGVTMRSYDDRSERKVGNIHKAGRRPSDPHPDMMEKPGSTLGRFMNRMFGDTKVPFSSGSPKGSSNTDRLRGSDLAFPTRLGKPMGPRHNHMDPHWPKG